VQVADWNIMDPVPAKASICEVPECRNAAEMHLAAQTKQLITLSFLSILKEQSKLPSISLTVPN
jgi:hypothetical protein